MSLSPIQKEVLKLIAQDGDYVYLQHLLSEYSDLHSRPPDAIVLETVREPVRTLIREGLVELYLQDGPRSSLAKLSGAEAEPILARDRVWYPREDYIVEEYALAPTPAGEEIFREP